MKKINDALFFILILVFLFTNSQALPVKVTTVQKVRDFCGTNKVKIIFDQKGTDLFYVNFSEVDSGTPLVHEIKGTNTAILPVLSPDGNWFACATGPVNEFDANPSASWMMALTDQAATPIKISDNAYVPRFVKNSAQPAVVYSTCSLNPNPAKNALQGCGVVKTAQWNGSSWSDSTLWPGGSYLSGLSYDNRYLADGEQSLHGFMLDLQNSANGPAQIHNIPALTKTGKDTTVTSQVCNASISSSRLFTNSMMYLDFGFDSTLIKVHSLIGGWDFHKRIFISDYSGAILKYYDPPQNIVPLSVATDQSRGNPDAMEWNYPEWSNHPYFAAVTLNIERIWYDKTQTPPWVYQMKNEKVCILNIQTGAILPIVESIDTSLTSTTNLEWPFLWVDMPASFSEPAGWLAIENQNPASRLHKGHISLDMDLLTSGFPMSKVELYTLSGKLLWRFDAKGKKMVRIHDVHSSGVRLLKIRAMDNSWFAVKVQFCK